MDKIKNLTESKSTDKLSVINSIIDKTINSLPDEKKDKIKNISIKWETGGEYGKHDHPLPLLNITFFRR